MTNSINLIYSKVVELKDCKKIKTDLNYGKGKNFLHCERCVEDYKKNELSQMITLNEYMLLEISEYSAGGDTSFWVVWCKRCKKEVWDSRDPFPFKKGSDNGSK